VNVNGYRGRDSGWDDHPVAAAAAITATAAVAAAAIGSIVNSVPPSCSTVVVNGISYSQCSSTWYQPQYAGTSVQYVAVPPHSKGYRIYHRSVDSRDSKIRASRHESARLLNASHIFSLGAMKPLCAMQP
jgi:hypothetical protein